MIKGNEVQLTINGDGLAAGQLLDVDLMQQAVEYDPIPGTLEAEENEGWRVYRRGDLSCNINHSGLFTTDSQDIILYVENGDEIDFAVGLGEGVLEGKCLLSSLAIDTQHRGVAKLNVKLEASGFPELVTA